MNNAKFLRGMGLGMAMGAAIGAACVPRSILPRRNGMKQAVKTVTDWMEQISDSMGR